MNQHLSDTVIQQYALNNATCDGWIQEHMLTCSSCNIKAKNYQVLFSEIKDLPKPVFEFDLPGLVLEKLPAEKSALPWAMPAIAAFSLAFVAGTIYFFKDYLTNIFKGISVAVMCLIVVSALLILIFQSLDTYRKYQRKLDSLNVY